MSVFSNSRRFGALSRLGGAGALLLALSACVGAPERTPAKGAATSQQPAAPSRASTAFAAPDARACLGALADSGVRFTPLPDQHFGGGCTALNAVRLSDIGTPVSNLGPMTCPLARAFTGWVQYAVLPAARQHLGQSVVRVETMGTYSCRNIYGGRSGRLSQHAHANAVDVSAFVLADGRRITLVNGWNGDPQARAFLRALQASACRRFGTVLGPDYNAAHRDHFHFDMSGNGFCR